LFYRIRVTHLHVPPLRDRREDIPLLVDHFMRKAESTLRLTDEAKRAMENYSWPGNIRELQSVVEEISWMASSEDVRLEDLPPALQRGSATPRRRAERRRQTGDELFERLVAGSITFWGDVHPLFLKRDITRYDLRQLIHRGLAATHGNYR